MNKLRVIFIHGIAPTVINWDFSARLSSLITRKLVDYHVLPEGATAEEISEIITYERVNYSKIGDDAQNHLLNAYEQESEKLYGLSSRINRAAGLDKIRRQIITSVSDVMVYKSAYWSAEIHKLVVDKIEPYISSGDSVSIIAHSLGSVVAFDTLHENAHRNDKWKEAGFKPTNLFTMGSPIALFTLDLDRQLTGHRKDADPEAPHIPLVADDGVWYNFLDAQDLIAYPLQVLFKGRFTLEDIVVQTGANPRKAHDGYWDNREVADFVAGRLTLDYQRINAAPDDGVNAVEPVAEAAPEDGEKAEPVDETGILTRLLGL